LGIVNLPVFKPEYVVNPKVQKWMLLLFVHRELIFHLILMGFLQWIP